MAEAHSGVEDDPEDHIAFEGPRIEKIAAACDAHLKDLKRHARPPRSLDQREGIARMIQPEPEFRYSSPGAMCGDLTKETVGKWAL